MNELLDPWTDASVIAERLQGAGTALLVMVGAEQWCARCRDLRPQFETLGAEAPQTEVWLWLDIEDHADFLGDYSPSDLPVLLYYQGETLLAAEVIARSIASLRQEIGRIRECAHYENNRAVVPDPGVRTRLVMEDWAT